jgi:hypothetical protein
MLARLTEIGGRAFTAALGDEYCRIPEWGA